ncbi:hypothetical protein [Globicatella sanguinis]
MSGLKLRLSTCLRPTQLCGGRPTKRKSFDFLLLVYSPASVKLLIRGHFIIKTKHIS